MAPKIKKTLHINIDAAEANRERITNDDFDKYTNGDTMLMIFHQPNGVWGDHLTSALHVHSFYEMEFVYGGKGIHILGNSSLPMSRGCGYLRTPNNMHTTWQDNNDVLQAYKFQFTGDLLPQEIASLLITVNHGLCVHFTDDELSDITGKILRLRQEIREQHPYQALLVQSLFWEILVLFLRKYHAAQEEPSTYSPHVTETLRYINDNFRGEIRVCDLAKRLYLTPHYLGIVFREAVGKTILEYTLELRLQLAMQLLLHSDMSIGMIATECGFGSGSYFISRFRHRFGLSPLQFFRMQTGK